jgi:hypothetical protein
LIHSLTHDLARIPHPGPFVPRAERHMPLLKSMAAMAMAKANNDSVDFAKMDEATGIIYKSAQSPAMASDPAYAGDLTQSIAEAFHDQIKRDSVGLRLGLMQKSRLHFDGANSLTFPSRAGRVTDMAGAFRAEGAPIRVGAIQMQGLKMSPRSCGVIAALSEELLSRGEGIEQIIHGAIIEDTGIFVDGIMFSNRVRDAVNPGGLWNYAAPGGIQPGSTSPENDLRNAMLSMADRIPSGDCVWVMNTADHIALRSFITGNGTLRFPVIPGNLLHEIPVIHSTNVPANTVTLLDTSAFRLAWNFSGFKLTNEGALHEEDSTPLPVVDGAGVASAPVRSLYQTNSVSIRALFEADWAMLATGSIAAITNTVGWI